MSLQNIEIKCKHSRIEDIESKLISLGAKYVGIDIQVDTYFSTPTGRLKLREGNIENNLIYYERLESKDLKDSKILLHPVSNDPSSLKAILTKCYGVKKLVKKERKIFFIGNVKFHIDKVEDLGTFVEIEAIDQDGSIPKSQLKHQCEKYIRLLDLNPEHFVDQSYSDMIK